MKHSKGPWFADMVDGNNRLIVDSVGERIGLAFGHEKRPAEPNARLMAAAPEMWAALRDLVIEYKDLLFRDEGDCLLHKHNIEKAEAIIAKATGTD